MGAHAPGRAESAEMALRSFRLAASKDLPRNEQGHSIDQSLLSVGEMVRRAPGWARRVLTMTGFLKEIGTQSLPRSPYPNIVIARREPCDRRGAVSGSERVLLGCDLMLLIRRLHPA